MTETDRVGPPTTGVLRVAGMPRWHTGRGELFVAGGVVALAAGLAIGTVTMEVPDGTPFPGPQFFPTLVVIFLVVVGVALAIDVLRHPRRPHVAGDPVEISDEMLQDLGDIDSTSEIRIVSPEDVAVDTEDRPFDTRTVLITVAALAAFILVLPAVGWILSAAALFWVIAWAFGSRRPLFDIAVGVMMSSAVQLAFGAALGLPLPAGFLEGVL